MLLDYIEKLREKPRAARKRFAFMSALVFTSLVAVGWGVTLPARLAEMSQIGPLGIETTDDLGAGVGEAAFEIQQTIDMEALGYQPDEPTIMNGDTDTEWSSATGTPETNVQERDASKPRPVIIATSSSETR